MKNPKLIALLYLLFVIGISWLSFQQLATPEPALPGYSPDSYSAYRAIEHLKTIAREPHSSGTVPHKKVRNYIFDFCKKHGLETKVYNQTGMQQYGPTIVAGNSFNILGKLKGTNSTKAVLVMSHYDSQPNTPGAADDGSGVASMLEVIDLMSKRHAPKNDIYFLFTDLEEVGLLGAEAFVHFNDELQDIGIILNYEARGNSGANFTFETSSDNGWVVREFSKAVANPLANSLAYEIYKLMPNDTDFTRFRDTGIAGLNSGFIDGYSYYHSAIDTHQNIDLGSLQHQGDLMWQMVNHFGNQDLSNTNSDDVIFFSIFGSLVIYPAWLDWPLIIVSLIGVILLVVIGIRNKEVQFSKVLLGILNYILSILLALGFTWLLTWVVLSMNPHYSNFYSNNFYNATIYLWMFLGAALLSFSVISGLVFKRLSSIEKIIGGLIIHGVLLLALKNIVPTGAFILYVPMLPFIVILMIKVLKQNTTSLFNFIIPVAPLVLWVPFIYFLFVVFSLSLPYASVFFMVLLFPYLEYTLKYTKELYDKLLIGLAVIISLAGFVAGQMTSDYTDEKPLQTQLTYALNLDQNEAFWISRQKNKDKFINSYIESNEIESLTEIYPQSSRLYWKSEAPIISLPKAHVSVVRDTTLAGSRIIELEITASKDVTYFNLILPKEVGIIGVNEREMKIPGDYLVYYAPASTKCKITLSTDLTSDLPIILIESHLGIGSELLSTQLPPNFIFGTGRLSNNKLVKQTIAL